MLLPYAWIGTWGQFDFSDLMGYYNLQAEAFLDGGLSVAPPPGQELTQDLIPFEGRYYLQWGPFPAVPHAAAILAGASISDRLVCLLAGWLTAVLFLEIVLEMRRRFYPETPLWVCWSFFFSFALATPAAVVALRGAVYHESIGVAALGVVTAFWAFLKYSENFSPAWLFAAGLAIAVAVTSRVTQGLYAAGLAAGIWACERRRGRLLPRLALFAAPVAAAALLMLAYNQARFGSPFEYGLKYLPASWAKAQPYDLRRVPENLAHYLLAPFRLTGDVPWIRHAGWRGGTRVEVAEEMSSLVLASPFLLLALLRGRGERPPAARIFRWTAAGSGLLVFFALLCYFWAARRYMHDFLPAWTIAAFAGAAGWVQSGQTWQRWRPPAIAILALSAALHLHLCFFQALAWSPSDPNAMKAFARWSPLARRLSPGPKLDEQEAMVNNDLGVVFLKERRYAEAIRHFERAAERLPQSERIQANLRLARSLVAR